MKPKTKKIILLVIIIGIIVFSGILIKKTHYNYVESVKISTVGEYIPIAEIMTHMKGYSKIIDFGLLAFVGIILCVAGIDTITQNEKKKAMRDNSKDNTVAPSDNDDNKQHIR